MCGERRAARADDTSRFPRLKKRVVLYPSNLIDPFALFAFCHVIFVLQLTDCSPVPDFKHILLNCITLVLAETLTLMVFVGYWYLIIFSVECQPFKDLPTEYVFNTLQVNLKLYTYKGEPRIPT